MNRTPVDLELDLDVFQGPFDLLCTLLLKEEIDFGEVELAEVCAAFLARLDERGRLDLDADSQALVLLASLVEVKSRWLLPAEGDEEEEGPTAEEARAELIARLVEYARFRRAATMLRERMADAAGRAYRLRPLPRPVAPSRADDEEVEQRYPPAALAETLARLATPPPRPSLSHLERRVVPIARRVRALRVLMAAAGVRWVRFAEAVSGLDRPEEAATFLAVLEMCRAGEAETRQHEPFGPFEMRAREAAAAPGSLRVPLRTLPSAAPVANSDAEAA